MAKRETVRSLMGAKINRGRRSQTEKNRFTREREKEELMTNLARTIAPFVDSGHESCALHMNILPDRSLAIVQWSVSILNR